MLKKIILTLAIALAGLTAAYAAVEVNTADQAALESVKGLGPVKSKAIIEERKKGAFKDEKDLASRVKGLGDKSVANLIKGGLTINGKGDTAKKEEPKKDAKKEDKKEDKKDAKK